MDGRIERRIVGENKRQVDEGYVKRKRCAEREEIKEVENQFDSNDDKSMRIFSTKREKWVSSGIWTTPLSDGKIGSILRRRVVSSKWLRVGFSLLLLLTYIDFGRGHDSDFIDVHKNRYTIFIVSFFFFVFFSFCCILRLYILKKRNDCSVNND